MRKQSRTGKKALIGVLLAFLLPIQSWAAAPQAAPWALQIASHTLGEKQLISLYSKSGHFHVVLTNLSDRPLLISAENTSWGYYNLKFEMTDANGKTLLVAKKPRGWDSNFPRPETIRPGDHFVFDVDLDPAIWENSPLTGASGQEKYRIRVIYESLEEDRRELEGFPYGPRYSENFWTGRVTSDEGEFVLSWKRDVEVERWRRQPELQKDDKKK